MSRVAFSIVDPAYRAGSLALALSIAAILTALGYEHLGGLAPCPLCLQQRFAFYAGIPVLFLALVFVTAERRKLSALLFAAVAIGFVANAGLGAYHAGVEWKFWLGPDTCGQPIGELKPLGKALIDRLELARVVRCDEASWRFLGLSFAGWNVIGSLISAAAAAKAAFMATRKN